MAAEADGSVLTPGMTFEVETVASPSTFTTINGVRDLSGAGNDRPLVKATDLADTVEKYHLGRKDGTQVTLDMRFINRDPGQEFLRDAHDSGDTVTIKVTFPNTSTRQFDALVMTWPENFPDNEHIMISVGLKITSDITRVDPT